MNKHIVKHIVKLTTRWLRIWVLRPYSFLGLSGLLMLYFWVPCARLSPD